MFCRLFYNMTGQPQSWRDAGLVRTNITQNDFFFNVKKQVVRNDRLMMLITLCSRMSFSLLWPEKSMPSSNLKYRPMPFIGAIRDKTARTKCLSKGYVQFSCNEITLPRAMHHHLWVWPIEWLMVLIVSISFASYVQMTSKLLTATNESFNTRLSTCRPGSTQRPVCIVLRHRDKNSHHVQCIRQRHHYYYACRI